MIGFLKKMLKKNKKIERDDPVFGGIELEHAHGIDMWWHLPSDDKDHMVVIYASSTGPSQAQRNFYDTLRRDIVSLEATCKEFISRQQDIPPNLSDMRIYSIEIGEESELEDGQFTVEFSDRDEIEIHRVEFRNGAPQIYGVDD